MECHQDKFMCTFKCRWQIKILVNRAGDKTLPCGETLKTDRKDKND